MANLAGNLESQVNDPIRSVFMSYSSPVYNDRLTKDDRPGARMTQSSFDLWTGRLPIIGDGLMREDRLTERGRQGCVAGVCNVAPRRYSASAKTPYSVGVKPLREGWNA
jgi:hypothetical protein